MLKIVVSFGSIFVVQLKSLSELDQMCYPVAIGQVIDLVTLSFAPMFLNIPHKRNMNANVHGFLIIHVR